MCLPHCHSLSLSVCVCMWHGKECSKFKSFPLFNIGWSGTKKCRRKCFVAEIDLMKTANQPFVFNPKKTYCFMKIHKAIPLWFSWTTFSISVPSLIHFLSLSFFFFFCVVVVIVVFLLCLRCVMLCMYV